MFFFVLIASFFVYYPEISAAKSIRSIKSNINTIDDVHMWLQKNLYPKNVKPWDKAPSLSGVIRDGYGDCKMLAGVTTELLNDVGVESWIVTISKDRRPHMFNVYIDSFGSFRVINNARLVEKSFGEWSEILNYYGVEKIIMKHKKYKDFRRWFNREVYPHGK